MSELQGLIQKLCPDGVEYKKLGDKQVSIMQRGTSLTKNNSTEGAYPVISGGRVPAFYCDKFNREGETITVAGSGAGAGYVQYWNEPIFVCDAFSIKGCENVSTKYLYYCLTNVQDKIYATKNGGGVPHVHISSIENFLIPIPHPAIQEEIVKILDRFADYAAELQAELQARQEQYEYYRNKLLSFNSINRGGCASVTWMKMSEIGDICMCKRIMKDQTNNIGGIPFYKIGTFGKVADAYISRELYEDYKSRFSFPIKGEILISASGTIGRTVVYDGKDAYFQDSNIVWLHNDEAKVLNRYLYHYYQIIEWNVEGGTIKRLYNNNLAKTKIAVPSLSEQERIVSILDKFESLTNDLSQGLPAEIAAVQEQYEYYRDKLLSFPRNKISA
mgnify:CR=1 FL=1